MKTELKYNKPLLTNDIPHDGKLIIIDNYPQSNFNYIVNKDKIYHAQKGRNAWVDISDNDIARKNLFTFLHDRYNFAGYSDVEKKRHL